MPHDRVLIVARAELRQICSFQAVPALQMLTAVRHAVVRLHTNKETDHGGADATRIRAGAQAADRMTKVSHPWTCRGLLNASPLLQAPGTSFTPTMPGRAHARRPPWRMAIASARSTHPVAVKDLVGSRTA